MSSFKGIDTANILGLSEPLSKLFDSISKGIGKVYEPTHIRRMAKAKATELELISKALTQNINLPTNYDKGDIIIDTSNYDELIERTKNRLIFQEVKKQQNIDSVISYAYNELEQETEVSSEEVDSDWIIRFMNSVEDISNKEMQVLWGKILAGEVRQPSTYTLRTLDRIRNISVSEAHKFMELSKFVLSAREYVFIMGDTNIKSNNGIKFEDILLMEECGLISSQSLSLTMKTNIDKPILINNSKIVGILKSQTDDYIDVKINIHLLTDCGKQLYSIIDSEGDFNYAIESIRFINKKSLSEEINVSAHKILDIMTDGVLRYEEKNIL